MPVPAPTTPRPRLPLIIECRGEIAERRGALVEIGRLVLGKQVDRTAQDRCRLGETSRIAQVDAIVVESGRQSRTAFGKMFKPPRSRLLLRGQAFLLPA